MTELNTDMESPSTSDFEALLNETMGENGTIEGTVVKGTITAISGDEATVDVGLAN